MLNKKNRVWLVGALIMVVLVAGFGVKMIGEAQENNAIKQAEAERLAEIERQEEAIRLEREAEAKRLEEERLRLEEEARKKEAEEKARLENIKANTIFTSASGATLYKSAAEGAEVIEKLPSKMAIYQSGQINDANGVAQFYEVKADIDSEVLGFVKAVDTVRTLEDYIVKKYDDVDYSYIEKTKGFESNPKIPVKAIYITGKTASGARLDEMIQMIDETELNAVVVDVKDDEGYLLFHSATAATLNPEANEKVYISDMDAFVKKMKEHNIYLIARIVTFKSPIYAKNHPERAIVYKNSGELYSDSDKLIWASAHDRTLWQYNVGIAKEAAALGFNEIQFDYVRFPAIARQDDMDFRNETGESQTAAIQNFLKFAYENLSEDEVYISADVFGWAASALDDVGIGQHWESVANAVDYICPMMYPSHYGPGNFGLSVPDAFPYETIDRSLRAAMARNANLQSAAGIRPWIQDFTATWVEGYIPYRTKEVHAQIQALKDNGIDEYLVWNAGNYYHENAFK